MGGPTQILVQMSGERGGMAGIPVELRKLREDGMGSSGIEIEDDGVEVAQLEGEANGVSIGGEITFTKAVGDFLRDELRMGSFKNN
jgi:hypothetical protein